MSPIPTPRVVAAHAQKLKIPASSKTLTPKRKHRKMLKDGTSEVWPEDVEQVFVEGLRQYWKSPYATFSSGRSRWRNAYLVEYLQKAGVTRTKKQVASHIQVLRNMWKGESEYSLVAGADEDPQVLPPTSPTSDDDDSDAGSGSASAPSPLTPSGSPFEDAFAAVPAHAHSGQYRPSGASSLRVVATSPSARVKTEDVAPDLIAAPRAHGFPPSYAVPRSFATTPVASSSYSDHGLVLAPDLIPPSSYPLTPVATDASSSFFPQQSYSRHRPSPTPSGSHPIGTSNRLAGFTVWSDRAMICTVAPDAIRDSVRAAIRVSLQVPGPMTVVPAVSVAAPWVNATCSTTIVINGQPKYETSVPIPSPTATTPGAPIIACLPDPWLSNMRWMNYQSPLVVSQRLVVDGAPIALIEYNITLAPDSGVLGHVFAVRGYAADGSPRWSPMAMPPVALPGSGANTAPRLACPPTATACAFDGGYQAVPAIAGSSAFGPFC